MSPSRSYRKNVPSRIVDLSAVELTLSLRSHQVSATEVIDAYAEQIERVNPKVNALVTLRLDEARAEAAVLDRGTAQGPPQPLWGVPFTVKDVIATAGVRTTCGSKLLSHYVPRSDATAVARLKRAGAILLGKSNCPEFALDPQTDNLLFGPTRNPWDATRTPGGSSGGESAAIAARCSPLGIGTDFGGSLRFPAHCTGIATIRPSAGLVPRTGCLPSLSTLDPPAPNSMGFQGQLQVIGPLARKVEDLALALAVLSGPDGQDALAVPVSLKDPSSIDVRDLSFAWCEGEGSFPVRHDIVAAVESVAHHLGSIGLKISYHRPPGLEEAESLYAQIRALDGLTEVRAVVGSRIGDTSPWIRALISRAREGSVPELLRANAECDRLRVQFLQFVSEHPILLMPVAAVPAFPLGQRSIEIDGIDLPYIQLGASCRAISLFGVPSAVVRCGTSMEGLPIGIQIVCPPFMDHVALAAAAFLEDELGISSTLPPVSTDPDLWAVD